MIGIEVKLLQLPRRKPSRSHSAWCKLSRPSWILGHMASQKSVFGSFWMSSRVVEPGSKPPALFSGVELTYYRHQVVCSVLIVGSTMTLISICIVQGETADASAGLEHNPFEDSLLENASRATKSTGSGEAS